MRMVVTFKSGRQIRIRVKSYEVVKSTYSNEVTKLEWEPDRSMLRWRNRGAASINYLNLSEIVSVHREG